MKNNRLAFALFATAVLFSMIREWSTPFACARIVIDQTHLFRRGQ
jgi:hypothetical protein